MSARVPTSRAYWNLRAEQVMGRVFDRETVSTPKPPHLIPVDVDVHEPKAQPAPAKTSSDDNGWLIAILGGIAIAGVVSSGWLIHNLQESRSQLEQERNLALIERLRDSIPAEQPVPATVEPPPLSLPLEPEPEPAWAASLEPLPLAEPAATPALEPLPQLTGVVQGPGGNSSAIFRIGSASVSAGIGDAIGSSGWTLSGVTDSGAVISRAGQNHTLSVGGVF